MMLLTDDKTLHHKADACRHCRQSPAKKQIGVISNLQVPLKPSKSTGDHKPAFFFANLQSVDRPSSTVRVGGFCFFQDCIMVSTHAVRVSIVDGEPIPRPVSVTAPLDLSAQVSGWTAMARGEAPHGKRHGRDDEWCLAKSRTEDTEDVYVPLSLHCALFLPLHESSAFAGRLGRPESDWTHKRGHTAHILNSGPTRCQDKHGYDTVDPPTKRRNTKRKV